MKKCTKCGEKNFNSNDVCDGCGAPLAENPNPVFQESYSNESDILKQLHKLESEISRIEKNTRNSSGFTLSKIDISFGELVVLIIKIFAASVPALIIFYISLFILMGVLGGIFGAF